MFHVVRVLMNDEVHYIIGDDILAIDDKVSAWEAMGGQVLDRTMVNGDLGMVVTLRKVDRGHASEIADTCSTRMRWG